ncbi:hypothetical protein CFP56_026191 [Quercus suber]|uniref:Transmembrane protein n=1 Tax=Quercus suber TaxID=58331 RepID=A0AAW0K3C7_QUESU
MATTTASLKWNHTFSIHLPPPPPPRLFPTTTTTSFTRPVKLSGALNLNLQTSSKLSVKCFIFTNKNKNHVTTDLDLSSDSKTQNPFEVFANTLLNAIKALRKPAVAAVLLGLLLLYDPNSALAASGGRMGGRSFSSSSSSRSYSVPRNSGGGFSFSAPYYAPSPFGGGGGFYMGPAVGVGSSFFFILMGFAAFVLVSGFFRIGRRVVCLLPLRKPVCSSFRLGCWAWGGHFKWILIGLLKLQIHLALRV